MKPAIYLSLMVLLPAVACKKKPVTQQPKPGSHTEDTAYTPLPAPTAVEECTDTFIGMFSS